MHHPTTQIIIPVHDPTRPLHRALSSVLNQRVGAAMPTEVIVVCHGLAPSELTEAYQEFGEHSQVQWLEFADGIASPAGPFNAGFDAATADYVAVMGSDDLLEEGMLTALAGHLAADSPDVLIFPLRHDGQKPLPNPLVRRGHTTGLDPVKDRLFYRTSPLAWIRRDVIEKHGLRFTAGLPAGVDMEFSARLWSLGLRADFHPQDPAYVIMPDATGRVTTAPRPFEVAMVPIKSLLTQDWVKELPRDLRQSLVIKTLRIHVLGALQARANSPWPQPAVDSLHQVVSVAQGLVGRRKILAGFNRTDGAILAAIMAGGSEKVWLPMVQARASASRLNRWVGYYPWHSWHRESDLCRLVRYRSWPH